MLLGLGASEGALKSGFELAAGQPLCKGLAVGGSVFQSAAEHWFAGAISNQDVIEQVEENYARLAQFWAQRGHCGNTQTDSRLGDILTEQAI